MVVGASAAGHQPALCQLLIPAFPAQLFKSELLLGQAGKVQPFKMTPGVLFSVFPAFSSEFFDAALEAVLCQADFHSIVMPAVVYHVSDAFLLSQRDFFPS